MATTATLNATDIKIMVSGTAITNIESADLEITMSPRETTTRDSEGWEEKDTGKKNWKMSGSSKFSFDAAYGFSDLFSLLINGTKVEVIFTTNETGDDEYTGDAFITSLKQSGGVEDTQKYDFSIDGTGALAESQVS